MNRSGAGKKVDPQRIVQLEPRQFPGSGNVAAINTASAEQLLRQLANHLGLIRDLLRVIRP